MTVRTLYAGMDNRARRRIGLALLALVLLALMLGGLAVSAKVARAQSAADVDCGQNPRKWNEFNGGYERPFSAVCFTSTCDLDEIRFDGMTWAEVQQALKNGTAPTLDPNATYICTPPEPEPPDDPPPVRWAVC